MSFSLDTRHTKYLPDYAAALRHHDSIKPIRGSNCRPIAERTKQHFNIRTQTNALTDKTSIIVRLHSTDIVTYTPDNRIVLDMGRWNTNSTRAAIHAVTGVTIQGTNPVWVQDYDHKYYLYKDNMQLEVQGYRTLKIIDPTYPVIHTLNKKAMNLLRKDYAPFIQYLKGFVKLIGEDGFTDELLAGTRLETPDYKPMDYAKGTHEDMHALARWIALAVRETHPRSFVYPSPAKVKLKAVLAQFNEHIIRAHKDTVLTRSTVTDGRMVKDRYAWVW
jgi:hypothetical protein